jgi:hypothetical protein
MRLRVLGPVDARLIDRGTRFFERALAALQLRRGNVTKWRRREICLKTRFGVGDLTRSGNLSPGKQFALFAGHSTSIFANCRQAVRAALVW